MQRISRATLAALALAALVALVSAPVVLAELDVSLEEPAAAGAGAGAGSGVVNAKTSIVQAAWGGLKHAASAGIQKVPLLNKIPEKYGIGCNHGHWCGETCVGRGGTAPPVDELDRACMEHDVCLEKNKASANTNSCGCGAFSGGNCGCDEELRRKARRLYDNGQKLKMCRWFELFCWESPAVQDAGWVAFAQDGRLNCSSCGGTSPSLRWQVGFVGCQAAVEQTKAAVAGVIVAQTGVTYETSMMIIDGAVSVAAAMANNTKSDRSFLLNITDASFTTPIAPVKLSEAAASNATLLMRIGDIAAALDSFTSVVTGGSNATMQTLVDDVAHTVAKATAATAEKGEVLKAMLKTAQVLQNITALATTGGSDAALGAGEAALGALGDAAIDGIKAGTEVLVQGLVTKAFAMLERVARAVVGDELTDVAQALAPGAAEAFASSVAQAVADSIDDIISVGVEAGAEAEAAGAQPTQVDTSLASTDDPLADDTAAVDDLYADLYTDPYADPNAAPEGDAPDESDGDAPLEDDTTLPEEETYQPAAEEDETIEPAPEEEGEAPPVAEEEEAYEPAPEEEEQAPPEEEEEQAPPEDTYGESYYY